MSDLQHPKIDVKSAIQIAKDYVSDVFAADNIKNVGLEEVDFDEAEDSFKITVGFSRPWDQGSVQKQLHYMFPDSAPRTYKIVTISSADGEVKRITNRLL